MDRKTIDAMWQAANSESASAGELSLRYHFAAAVAAAVKEEDARICIDYANRLAGISHHDHPPADEAAVDCADEIRASIKEVK